MLNKDEQLRYSRHTLLSEIGEQGQLKLKKAKILVVGAGGLGCPVLQYLTAAGVGTIGIIDFDKVSVSNLQRQILFTVEDIGKNKATTAAKRLKELNPFVSFETYPEKLTTENALKLFSKYDIIVDGTDNFSTRYLVNDASVITGKPLVYGSIFKFEGQVSVFNYKEGPSYRCLFPEPPKPGTVPSCSEIGVLGVLPGIIGCMQANEAIKIVVEIGEPLSGILCIFNTLSNQCNYLKFGKNEQEIEKVKAPSFDIKNQDYDLFCGIEKNEQTMFEEITGEELKKKLKKKPGIQLIDVREEYEQPKLNHENVVNIPLGELHHRYEEINEDGEVIVFCQHGVRSIQAIMMLQDRYEIDNLVNLKGGIVTVT